MKIQFRDPVHNFITLREKQVKLVGTAALRRLRGIRQLALASLVYPGAVHTRFDHSLGVTHVAGLMAEALGFDEDRIELVQLAALLHDIGHGPFSHVSESALERYANQETLLPEQKKEKIHEAITALMIQTDEEILRILGGDTCDQVIKLLGEGLGPPALKSIVSGPLDADKQDYLLRDSRFCGVQYGVFDIHQLHRSFTLFGMKDEEELMIEPDGTHAVEQYVLAKYYLTTNVYRHRVRLITDQMIVRAIVLGIEADNNQTLKQLYAFDNSAQFIKNYMSWDDARFMETFCPPGGLSRCSLMLKRLRERKLLKQVFQGKPRDFPAEIRDTLIGLSKREHDGLRKGIEKEIAEVLEGWTKQKIDPGFVIFHPYNIKSVRESSRNEEAGILVATLPKPRPFTEESTLFASINHAYFDQFIEVYAPVSWETETVKKKLRRECRDPIIERISKRCRDAAKGGPK